MLSVLSKKSNLLTAVLAWSLVLAQPAFAQSQTGSLKGKIVDNEGLSLPGAFVHISSPALLGKRNYVTSDSGRFGFADLAPGRYKITVEKPGFKTLIIEDINVEVGSSVSLRLVLEASEIEEEITRRMPTPAVDSQSVKISTVFNRDILSHIPMSRKFAAIVALAPGAVAEESASHSFFSIHGSSVRAVTYALGGVNATNPVTMTPMLELNRDIVEEVEIGRAAHPAETSPVEGAYVNVVPFSGGNKAGGQVTVHHSNDKISKQLYSREELDGMGVGPAPLDRSDWDFSLSSGGALLEDSVWYFTNFRMASRSREAPFLPWQDPLGHSHSRYDWSHRDLSAFFKLTAQFKSRFRASAFVSHADRYQTVDEDDLAWDAPKASTRGLTNEKLTLASGIFTWTIDQNTHADLNIGLALHNRPLLLDIDGKLLPRYYDAESGRTWGSGDYNERIKPRRFSGRMVFTRVQHRVLGTSHEIKAGAEVESTRSEWMTWKDDNLILTYLSESPYFFGTGFSPVSGNEVGKGLIAFSLASKEEGGLSIKAEAQRMGVFVQDTLSFADRISLMLGLRFDRSASRMPVGFKRPSGNGVSLKVGEELIKPQAGVNPYDQAVIPEWNSIAVWNSLSPRAGLSFDLFGNGRAVFKASYSIYPEYLGLGFTQSLSPFTPSRAHSFFWYDENRNSLVDAEDSYALYADDYRLYDPALFKKRIDPAITAPTTREWTLGVHQELFPDFSFSLNYINKVKRNIIDNVLYDPDSEKAWYSPASLAEGWWIPFSTTVPAVGDYPMTPVTVFFRSAAAPALFDRVQNVPELRSSYDAFELILRKRMSHNWQLYGSFVWSRSRGTIGDDFSGTSGNSPAAASPNDFVNLPPDSRTALDRPTAARLMGTYRFPLGFFLSFLFVHVSGGPWARSVTIAPPEAWVAKNGVSPTGATVLLEKPGARRYPSYETLDFRVERDFTIGKKTRMHAYLDVLNLLGKKSGLLDLNDGGFWLPEAENSSEGRRILSGTYEKFQSVRGTRVVRLGLSIQF